MTMLNTKVLPSGAIEVRGNVGLRREWRAYYASRENTHVTELDFHKVAAKAFIKDFRIKGSIAWHDKNPLDATGFCFSVTVGGSA